MFNFIIRFFTNSRSLGNTNVIDVSAGADNNFGSTIAILAQDEEHPTSLKVCNTSSETNAAKVLASIFDAFN